MKCLKLITAAMLFSSVFAANAATNLVVNGDFSSGGSGWTLSGNVDSNSYSLGNWQNGATGTDAYLSQTLNTVAGTTYTLKFDYFATPNSWDYQEIGATWNGVAVWSNYNQGANDWVHQTITGLVATGSSVVLSFFNRNEASYNHLDNVIVSPSSSLSAEAPVPAAVWLLGSALVSLVGVGRRKVVGGA